MQTNSRVRPGSCILKDPPLQGSSPCACAVTDDHRAKPLDAVTAETGWLEFTVEAVQSGSKFVHTSHVLIHNTPETMSSCDSFCMCSATDSSRVEYSHECRASVQQGSHCGVPKEAHVGNNWASGVLDEYYVYKASGYNSGGRCQVVRRSVAASCAGCRCAARPSCARMRLTAVLALDKYAARIATRLP